ncbi:MAG: MBL fold metallo-hydrolase [Chloroflexi bacterium]|nr:MBL fold metallo-hydrolase [Chloroflexota bacterium]
MIEELFPDLYRMEIPLPRSPLKALNSYLLKGDGRYLIVDTGQNREECLSEMTLDLKKLNVDLARTDFFVTHMHADHSGLAGMLPTPTSKVYFSKIEAGLALNHYWRERFFDYYTASGFPVDAFEKAVEAHPGKRWGLKAPVDAEPAEEGGGIDIGDFSLKFIHTPGHTPGHICLYDASRKILFSGDHILSDITPNITHWPELKNSLKNYMNSLEKVYPLEVSLTCPGHRRVWGDHKPRIKELIHHHQQRCDEIVTALAAGEKDAFQIAPFITWDIVCDTWEQFPPAQMWFAFGETIAHIDYLIGEGTIRQKRDNGRITFALS